MRQTFTITFLLIICNYSIVAQTFSLLDLEKEYFSNTSDSIKSRISLQKMNILIQQDSVIPALALFEANRINTDFLLLKEKENYYWNCCILNCLNKNINCNDCSTYFLNKYYSITSDSSLYFHCLVLMNIIITNSTQLTNYFKDTNYVNIIECLTIKERNNKREMLLNKLSIIPGLGLIAKGEIIRGSSALILNLMSGYLVYYLIKNKLYINSVLWATQSIGRFYPGQKRLTFKSDTNKLKRAKKELGNNCLVTIDSLLSRNEVKFRY